MHRSEILDTDAIVNESDRAKERKRRAFTKVANAMHSRQKALNKRAPCIVIKPARPEPAPVVEEVEAAEQVEA